ncbi:MAG: MarR family transcriptional regulator [Rubrobacter sp.]|jgi:DNA-binding MarR family transcriptional regulator|nr:MarR family transcriptional regulator [Rubrobacter sp.]
MGELTATKERSEGHVLFSQLLRNPYQAFLTKLHARLAAAGYADTAPSWGHNIFFYLREGGLRLTELAERAHTTKQAMRYTVNQLEAAGYVERVPDPTDGRAKIIRLTERGWAARRLADEIIASIEGECARHLGEQRMRQFEGLMKDVSSALGVREHG